MSNIVETLLWLSIPIAVPVLAWFLLRSKSKVDPNANVGLVESDLQRLRSTLSTTNPVKPNPVDFQDFPTNSTDTDR